MTTNRMPPRTEEDVARFMSSVLFVDQGYTTPCWVWTQGMFREGYGCFTFGGKAFRAHRVLWAWENGYDPIRPLDHLCHDRETCAGGWTCPHRVCVNPDHLKEVTQRDNVIRGTGPSAANAAKTHCDHGHEFTPENTYEDPRTGWRQCVTCRTKRSAAAYEALTDEDRDQINARRREIREHVIHGPRPCEVCGTEFIPKRVGSGRGRLCPEPPKSDAVAYAKWRACINERQRLNRNKRLERPSQ